jgi:predicted ABC-class ATPase
MQVEVELPNRGVVSGMGVARGVTLIVGGGFHGNVDSSNSLYTKVRPHATLIIDI